LALALFQQTLAAPVIFAGQGLHSGVDVRVAIKSAAPNAGLTFVRTDVYDRDNRVPARGDAVTQTRLGTVVGNAAGVTVATI